MQAHTFPWAHRHPLPLHCSAPYRPLMAVTFAALLLALSLTPPVSEAGSWCVARSGASQASLQAALDYACSTLADCGPIQASGLCYLPNTLQAHASYAFNSYYQRSNYAPTACDFAGTATQTVTDPSYGSCTYPSSPSSAGGAMSPPSPTTPVSSNPPTPTNSPTNGTPTTFPSNSTGGFGGFGGGGGLSPGFSPGTTDLSGSSIHSLLHRSLFLSFSVLAAWYMHL